MNIQKAAKAKLLTAFYIKKISSMNLKKQLRAGSIARATRDVSLAVEWFGDEQKIVS